MLNSLQLTTDHYSLKFKSMFDLAIATQRYSTLFPSSHHHQPPESPTNFVINQQRHQQHYPPQPFATHNIQLQGKSQGSRSSVPIVNNTSGLHGSVQMEEGNVDIRNDIHTIQICQKSSESSLSPIPNMESAMTHINYNNNNLIASSISPQASTQTLNFMHSRGGVNTESGEGKHRGKKQGPSGNKTSFSIESLLAHSNTWRKNQSQEFNSESGGSKILSGKETRFLPYPLPSQSQQQNRAASRQNSAENSGTSKIPSVGGGTQGDNEKRCENYGSSNGGKSAGNGRRAAKSKRVRTIFTPEQLERLEAEFERQQYMVGPERLYLASSLYLTEAQVKVWFQNRRIKWRKQHLEMEQQRLAIYRTLAEQDMIVDDAEQEEEDSADCDYVVDEVDYDYTNGGTEDDGRSIHSVSSHQQGITVQRARLPGIRPSSQPPINSSLDLFNHTSAEKPECQSTQANNSSIHQLPTSASSKQFQGNQGRIRLLHQQNSNNDEYDTTCSPTTSSTSSSASSSSVLRGASSTKAGNHGTVQGAKK